MNITWWLIIFFVVISYLTIYTIYDILKTNSLRKKLINYKGEKVLYQDYYFATSWSEYGDRSFFTILTKKKLYLILFMSLFPIYWKRENKSIKEVIYNPVKLRHAKYGYIIKVDNHAHRISENQINPFIKKLKSLNPKIKFISN